MNNTTKKRILKLTKLFNSNLTVEQVIKELLKENTDFTYCFVFSADSEDNEKTEYFEKNKVQIKNVIMNIISTQKLSFDKFYNIMLIYTEDDPRKLDSFFKKSINTKINEKNIKLFKILLDMEVDRNYLEDKLTSLAELIN